ncbi:MAG: CpXC domain-containing protein [Patescibacteria group bacterium]|nr:CpXC domain-containing protein [Patescibacteria group bacterium]
MAKEEFLNFVQQNVQEKVKNAICPYCGSDNRISVADGIVTNVLDTSKKQIFEDIVVSLACSKCGYISSFLPQIFFGDKISQYYEFIYNNQTGENEEEKEKNSEEKTKGE